jgi:hypothetical protein
MPDSQPAELNAMVVFSSRYGDAEKLALAAGVGAVQARANIRLRRLADLTPAEEIARDARWAGMQERLKADYIAPREIDADWAHVVIFAAPVEEVPEPAALAEANAYFKTCKDMHGKLAIILTPSRELLGGAALAGFTVIPPPKDGFKDTAAVKAFGKQTCEIARRVLGN